MKALVTPLFFKTAFGKEFIYILLIILRPFKQAWLCYRNSVRCHYALHRLTEVLCCLAVRIPYWMRQPLVFLLDECNFERSSLNESIKRAAWRISYFCRTCEKSGLLCKLRAMVTCYLFPLKQYCVWLFCRFFMLGVY